MMSSLFQPSFHLFIVVASLLGLIVAYLNLSNQNSKEISSANGDVNQIRIARKSFLWGKAALLILLCTSLATYWQDVDKDIKELKKTILDSTDKIKSAQARAIESDSLRKRSDELLRDVKKSLRKSDSILNQQKIALKGTSDLLENNLKTSRYIFGAEGVPKIILKISDIKSSSQYKVTFLIRNESSNYFHDVQGYGKNLDDVEKEVTGYDRLPYDSLMVRFDNALHEGYKPFNTSPVILPNGTTKVLQKTYLNFSTVRPVFGKEQVYRILVQWSTGYYHLTIPVNTIAFMPVISNIEVWYKDKIFKISASEKNTFFELANEIDADISNSINDRVKKAKVIDERRQIQKAN